MFQFFVVGIALACRRRMQRAVNTLCLMLTMRRAELGRLRAQRNEAAARVRQHLDVCRVSPHVPWTIPTATMSHGLFLRLQSDVLAPLQGIYDWFAVQRIPLREWGS